MIKGYHTDNCIFNSLDFMVELLKKQQKISLSGAGASHQNGAADRAIKTVVTIVRTMLMHTALICPKNTLSTYLWSMAMDYAVWFYNRTPDMQSELSAIEIWSRSRFEPSVRNPYKLPCFGLSKICFRTKVVESWSEIPKWDPRSRREINMGFRNMHSTQVGLVINLLTGSISPQYHVLFDDMLSTVMSSTAADPEVWIRLFTSRNSSIQVILYQEDDI